LALRAGAPAALQRVTDAALAYLSLEELLDRIAAMLATDTAAFLLLDETGDVLVARAAINLPFGLGEELRTRRLELRLVVVPASPIARMLAITSLDRAVPTYGAVPEALAG
jgi:hypothetical protein